MQPLRTNSPIKTCADPSASNCVLWNGGSLKSIPVCEGDTVSDIITKLDLELFYIKSLLNLTDLNLSCVSNNCTTCEDKTPLNVLQLIINYICGGVSLPDPCPTVVATPARAAINFTLAPIVTTNVVYSVSLYDTTGTALVASKTYTNPTGLVTDVFSNLPPVTSYLIKTIMTVTGKSSVICPSIQTNTL